MSTGLSYHFDLFNFNTGSVEIRGGSKAATKQRMVQLQKNYSCHFDRVRFLSRALYTCIYYDGNERASGNPRFQWDEHKRSK